MKKFIVLTISVFLLVGIVGSVHAERLYSTTFPFFSDGLDLMTGDTLL